LTMWTRKRRSALRNASARVNVRSPVTCPPSHKRGGLFSVSYVNSFESSYPLIYVQKMAAFIFSSPFKLWFKGLKDERKGANSVKDGPG
jgi:hypothetical protein